MKSVKVPLKKLNDVRKELMEKELMRMDYRIKAEKDYGYIPIKEDIEGYRGPAGKQGLPAGGPGPGVAEGME